MSYKVMIVDDEPIIRFGLSSCVNWDNEGLSLVAEASNGEAALNQIREQAIHILITDIRMPLMDGLELTRQVKELLPDVKVILVSSYSDFEFAREAVKLGVVVDYLLKPTMEPENLIHILRICKQRLDEEQLRYRKEERFEHEEYKHRMMQLEYNLKSYLSETVTDIEWKPDWLSGPIAMAIWKYDASDENNDLPRMVWLESVKEQLNTWCEEGISLVTGKDEIVTVIADHNGEANHRIKSYHHQLAMNEGSSFTVGISPTIHSYKRMRDALSWASFALESSFFHGRGQCYMGCIPARLQDRLNDKEEKLQQEKKILRDKLAKSFASSDRDQCMETVELYVGQWNSGDYSRQDIILEARNLIMMSESHYVKHQSEEAMSSLMDKLTMVESCPTIDVLVSYIRREINRLWEPGQLLIATDDASGAHTIQLALSYIQDNYRQEISLQEVADYAHMSKNYFSEQFKKRMGFNFIDFVIRLRIHYAKHLLETTSLRIVDIGIQSGFNSPKHFLKLFKRMSQMTPGEYRDQMAKKQGNDDGLIKGHER
jgi:two-component system response regulator YesN